MRGILHTLPYRFHFFQHPMHNYRAATTGGVWDELATADQIRSLARLASQRHWGLTLVLIGWLHLFAFLVCYGMTILLDYHEAPGYLTVWFSELAGVGLLFRLCGGPRSPEAPPPLARFVYRVWIAYFLLAFNLASMNTLRGHRLFELFPAMASLASFAFLIMTFTIHRRFFAAVLVMFFSGLLMAAFLLHAFLVFAVAWWLVLNGIGWQLMQQQQTENHRVMTGPVDGGHPPVGLAGAEVVYRGQSGHATTPH